MGWLKRFSTKLKEVFGFTPKPPLEKASASTTPQAVRAPGFIGKVMIEEGQAPLADEKDFHFRKSLLATGEHFWQGGWEDGKFGQAKTQIGEIARTNAFFIRDEIESVYHSKQSQLETECSLKQAIYENVKQDYDTNDKYHKSVNEQYRKNSRAFSKPVGIFYVMIAVLLTLADIPLALMFIEIGFDLNMGSWEVFLLALGVAFCTVAIKIFYDEFIERPLAHTVTQFKNLEGVETPEEKRKIKRVHFVRLFVKVLVLFLTLTTIFMMGKFRFEAEKLRNSSDGSSDSADPFSESMSQISEPVDRLGSSNQPPSATHDDEKRQFVTEWTFTFMTILFPLISGICASLGLNYLGNHRELKTSRDFCEASKQSFLAASKDFDEVKKKELNLGGLLTWCRKDDFVENIRKLLLNYYNHGYQRGMLEPDPANLGKDLFTRAEELRNNLISRRILPLVVQNTSANGAFWNTATSQDNYQQHENFQEKS